MTRISPLLRALSLGAAVLLPATLHAQVRVRPTHDVVVTYRVEGEAPSLIPGGLPGPVRLFWDAPGQRLRAEAEGHDQVVLLDLQTDSGQAFDTALHLSLPVRLRPSDLRPLTLDGAHLVPTGQGRAAGLACTRYRVTLPHEPDPASVCLTPDGVPLSGDGTIRGRPGRFVATRVQYRRLPPDLFTVPPGYADLGHDGAMGAVRSLLDRMRRQR